MVGILGIIFYVDLVTDSPEDIKNMKKGDTITVYGTIKNQPGLGDYDPKGKNPNTDEWNWTRYTYYFEEGGYFYSEYRLDIEPGDSAVIDIEYKGAKEGRPEGPALEGKNSAKGTFLYRLPGIGVVILGLGVGGVGGFFMLMEFRKGKEKVRERKRKSEAVDKQMELLEREIQMALTSTGRRPDIQYQPPPGHPAPGQMPPQHPPQRPPIGQMPPKQGWSEGASGPKRPPQRPPMGQMPPRGPPGPPQQS